MFVVLINLWNDLKDYPKVQKIKKATGLPVSKSPREYFGIATLQVGDKYSLLDAQMIRDLILMELPTIKLVIVGT